MDGLHSGSGSHNLYACCSAPRAGPAKAVNQKLFVAWANDDAELDAALASFLEQRIGAFRITAAPFFDTRLYRIAGFAARKRLPAI